MSPAPDLDGRAKASTLFAKYGTRTDPESAREKLAARMEAASREREAEAAAEQAEQAGKAEQATPKPKPRESTAESAGGAVIDFLKSRQGQAIGKEIVRGVFGMLKKRR